MADYSSLTDTVDLPGFYQDPKTGRYFRIPINPNTCVPDLLEAAQKKEREESSFNQTPIQIRIGRTLRKASGGLPGILTVRQSGRMTEENFSTQVTKLKLRQLKQSNEKQLPPTLRNQLFEEFNISFLPSEPITCKFVVPYNSLYIGAWSMRKRTLVNSVKKIREIRKDESSPLHVITGITQNYITDLHKQNVVHMCPAEFEERKCILVCANSLSPIKSDCCLLMQVDDTESSGLASFEIESNFLFRSCAWNSKRKMIALSSEENFFIYRLDVPNSLNHHVTLPYRDHRAIEFCDSGDTIFTADPQGKLMGCDLRTDKPTRIVNVGRGIEYMKLLENDYTLITSGYDNKLSNIDIRMSRVVFQYPGFNNKHRKIPFTFNEDWNILCSPGQDNVTRFWSLREGERLASLEPPLKSVDQVYSIFTVEKNDLSTSIFMGDRMFCYEPL